MWQLLKEGIVIAEDIESRNRLDKLKADYEIDDKNKGKSFIYEVKRTALYKKYDVVKLFEPRSWVLDYPFRIEKVIINSSGVSYTSFNHSCVIEESEIAEKIGTWEDINDNLKVGTLVKTLVHEHNNIYCPISVGTVCVVNSQDTDNWYNLKYLDVSFSEWRGIRYHRAEFEPLDTYYYISESFEIKETTVAKSYDKAIYRYISKNMYTRYTDASRVLEKRTTFKEQLKSKIICF